MTRTPQKTKSTKNSSQTALKSWYLRGLSEDTSNAFIVVATISFSLALSALFIPRPSTPARAQTEIDLETTHQVCLASPTYGSCETLIKHPVAQRASLLPPGDLARPYQAFANCREAVDYLFTDRVDYARAIEVVYRESTNNPQARRPGSQYAGCSQLSTTLQATFLRGPWNDPYYNVLALRDAVDNPRWGWCHWDLVNYCDAGGEF